MTRVMGPKGTQSREFCEAVHLQWGFPSKPGSPKSSSSSLPPKPTTLGHTKGRTSPRSDPVNLQKPHCQCRHGHLPLQRRPKCPCPQPCDPFFLKLHPPLVSAVPTWAGDLPSPTLWRTISKGQHEGKSQHGDAREDHKALSWRLRGARVGKDV